MHVNSCNNTFFAQYIIISQAVDTILYIPRMEGQLNTGVCVAQLVVSLYQNLMGHPWFKPKTVTKIQ